ncbi:RNA-guided endonuclease TnpB family protein [Streptosporangium sandarakinum]|uniref:RNA-guided endonuclease TnpB family protein n=1 Tax=Streptosporangium sandarakinum TaxID=1260955 RepID=UPI003720F061
MMAVRLRYQYRLCPNAARRQALARAFGCARVVFNDGLRARTEAREAGLPYRRLRKAQQALSRKVKGSNNRKKAVVGVARAHARAADARRDLAHKLSAALIRDNQAVYVENLSVRGLARTRLAGSVHDAGWSAFVAMLEYKAARYGRAFARIDRWFPSSKLCSACGAVAGSMPLSVRSWTCPCGADHDRDVNAAINVLAAGRADRRNACGDPVRPPLAVARVGEAGSHRGAA